MSPMSELILNNSEIQKPEASSIPYSSPGFPKYPSFERWSLERPYRRQIPQYEPKDKERTKKAVRQFREAARDTIFLWNDARFMYRLYICDLKFRCTQMTDAPVVREQFWMFVYQELSAASQAFHEATRTKYTYMFPCPNICQLRRTTNQSLKHLIGTCHHLQELETLLMCHGKMKIPPQTVSSGPFPDLVKEFLERKENPTTEVTESHDLMFFLMANDFMLQNIEKALSRINDLLRMVDVFGWRKENWSESVSECPYRRQGIETIGGSPKKLNEYERITTISNCKEKWKPGLSNIPENKVLKTFKWNKKSSDKDLVSDMLKSTCVEQLIIVKEGDNNSMKMGVNISRDDMNKMHIETSSSSLGNVNNSLDKHFKIANYPDSDYYDNDSATFNNVVPDRDGDNHTSYPTVSSLIYKVGNLILFLKYGHNTFFEEVTHRL